MFVAEICKVAVSRLGAESDKTKLTLIFQWCVARAPPTSPANVKFPTLPKQELQVVRTQGQRAGTVQSANR